MSPRPRERRRSMRRTLPLVLSAAALLGPLTAARAADDDVKAVLAKAVKAHGGEERVAKYKASQSKSKGKIDLPMAGELDFTQEVSAMRPDKIKDTLELSKGEKKLLTRTLMYNGDK